MPRSKRQVRDARKKVEREGEEVRKKVGRGVKDLIGFFEGPSKEERRQRDLERGFEDVRDAAKHGMQDLGDAAQDLGEDLADQAHALGDLLKEKVQELRDEPSKTQRNAGRRISKLEKTIDEALEESPKSFNKKETSALTYLQNKLEAARKWIANLFTKKSASAKEKPKVQRVQPAARERESSKSLQERADAAVAHRAERKKAKAEKYKRKYSKPEDLPPRPTKDLPQPHQEKQPYYGMHHHPKPDRELPHHGKQNDSSRVSWKPPRLNMGRKGRG